MGETINIFPEEPLRMKMSFSSSGHCNFAPNCVYADGDALCWEINDKYYRMVYRVRYEDGRLRGVELVPAKYAEEQRKWKAHTPRMLRRSGGCSALLFEKDHGKGNVGVTKSSGVLFIPS